MSAVRIIGIDPGLAATGYGLLEVQGNRLCYLAAGDVPSAPGPIAPRLERIHATLAEIIARYQPAEAAIEKVFMSRNPQSALSLGHARGVAVLACAQAGLAVHEYSVNAIKLATVGKGHADKQQVQYMVGILLNHREPLSADAADALAVAICHAHLRVRPTIISEQAMDYTA